MNVQENQVGLKLNGTHQLLMFANDLNLLCDNIDTIKNYMETLIDVSKAVGLDVNREKTKYMLLSRHQNAGQNYDIKIANRWFENVEKFRYFNSISISILYYLCAESTVVRPITDSAQCTCK
jgi:hypothetical protein